MTANIKNKQCPLVRQFGIHSRPIKTNGSIVFYGRKKGGGERGNLQQMRLWRLGSDSSGFGITCVCSRQQVVLTSESFRLATPWKPLTTMAKEEGEKQMTCMYSDPPPCSNLGTNSMHFLQRKMYRLLEAPTGKRQTSKWYMHISESNTSITYKRQAHECHPLTRDTVKLSQEEAKFNLFHYYGSVFMFNKIKCKYFPCIAPCWTTGGWGL